MKYKKTGRYIYRNISGEGVLVPIRDGVCNLENMLLLNETSVAIWERFKDDEVLESSAILGWLMDEYEVQESQAAKDLEVFWKDLVESRCVEEIA